jgi:hypothetical protein
MIVRLEMEGELLAQVESAARGQGLEFKEFVNNALRDAVGQAKIVPPSSFTQKVHDFGTHLESPWTVLADLETNSAVLRK